MNRRLLAVFGLIAALVLPLSPAHAQTEDESARHRASFERQVRNVGYAGVGVETIVERWIAACPEEPEAYRAKFNHMLAKAQSTEVVQKDSQRYLGERPFLTLRDSTGRDVYYYQDTFFEDSLFASALSAAETAVRLAPDELRYRYDIISALIAYEKDSPDMGVAEINSLIDEFAADPARAWTLDGEALSSKPKEPDYRFSQAMGEYCYSFFRIGSEESYEYFLALSERMTKLDPLNPVFIDNIGSYWQVAKRNDRKAAKFYKKALKLDPDDYAAKTNLDIIQSSQSKQDRRGK